MKKNIVNIVVIASLCLMVLMPFFISNNVDALEGSFVVYGYIDQSNGSDVPLGTTVTITDVTTSSSDTTTTFNNGGDTGAYQYDLYGLSSCSDGDTITVNATYGGEIGSETYILDVTDPSKNMSFQLTNMQTYHTDYFNASINVTGSGSGSGVPVISDPSPGDLATVTTDYAELSVLISDSDGDTVDVVFYNAFTGALLGSDTVVGGSGRAEYNWTGLSFGMGYSWNCSASDGVNTTWSSNYRFTTSFETMTTVFSPSPASGAVNVSLPPELSVWVYDGDNSEITVRFYDNNDVLIHMDIVNLSSSPTGQASVPYASASSSDTLYEWYVMATTETNMSVRYPVAGYLNFTTIDTSAASHVFISIEAYDRVSKETLSGLSINGTPIPYEISHSSNETHYLLDYLESSYPDLSMVQIKVSKAGYKSYSEWFPFENGDYIIPLTPHGDGGGSGDVSWDLFDVGESALENAFGSANAGWFGALLMFLGWFYVGGYRWQLEFRPLALGFVFLLMVAVGISWLPLYAGAVVTIVAIVLFAVKYRDYLVPGMGGGTRE